LAIVDWGLATEFGDCRLTIELAIADSRLNRRLPIDDSIGD
jgi:hypothetical protein